MTPFFPPFFPIPFPENALIAKILYKDEIITQIDLAPKLQKDTMDRLIPDYEILIERIERSNIQKGIKNSLLTKLINAKMKAEQGLLYIEDVRRIQGENMLNSASNIVEAFINEVNAQREKKVLRGDVEGFITWAEKMILRPQRQIISGL